jgi:hypothetical protein
MVGEMRMQMVQPGLALASLLNVTRLYPNRFNSIAAAAAAAAALEASSYASSTSSLSPTAASLYAQLLALVALAPSLRAASSGLPGESFGLLPFPSILFNCVAPILPSQSSS